MKKVIPLCSFLVLSFFSCSTIEATTYYEVWRNTTNSSSSATLIKEWITGTTYDDTSAASGQHYYYWTKVVTADTFYGSSSNMITEVTGKLWMTCPTAAVKGTSSRIKYKARLEPFGFYNEGTLTNYIKEQDTFSDDTMALWTYPQTISISGTTAWEYEWTKDIIISNYEPANATAEVYGNFDFLHGNHTPYTYHVMPVTAVANCSLLDSFNSAPTGVNASKGDYTDKIQIQWNPASGISSFSSSSEGWLSVMRTLTVNSSGATGVSISSSTSHGGTTNYTKTVADGTIVNVQAPQYVGSGASRKSFNGWTGSAGSTSAPSFTFTMNGNMTITANYVNNPEPVTLAVYSSGASSVSISSSTGHGGTTNYTKTVNSGTTVTLTAPSTTSGQTFTGWTGDVTSSSQTISFSMNGDMVVVANYAVSNYTLTVNSSGASSVSISSSTGHEGTTNYTKTILYGTSVTLTAPSSANGQTFTGWTGDVTSSNQTISFSMNGNKSVTASFTQIVSNDNFANASSITGLSGQTTGSNIGATKESGEPSHAGNAGGASVWWYWTASASGQTTLDTFGSNFDTLLAVYTGSSVNILTQVASNDDSGGLQSQVTFTSVSGTTYYIAVDGYAGHTGNIILNWNLAIPQFGSLGVSISPQAAIDVGAQWRLIGTSSWHNSGDTETGIAIGQYTIEFKYIAGWSKPANQAVTILNSQTIVTSGIYEQQSGNEVFHLLTTVPITTVPVGANLKGVTYCPVNKKVYVVSWQDGSEYLYVVDANTWTLENTITNQLDNHGDVAVSKDGRHVYTGNYYGGSVTRFDRDNNWAKITLGLGSWANELLINSDGSRILVGLGYDGRSPTEDTGSKIAIIDTNNWTSTGIDYIELPELTYGETHFFILSLAEDYIYATSRDANPPFNGKLLKISMSTKAVIDSTLLVTEGNIDISKDGTIVMLAMPSGNVQVMSTSDLSLVHTINVGGNPTSIATSPDGRYAIVCNNDSNSVSVIDLSNWTVCQTITSISKSYEVSFDTTGQYAFVIDNIADNGNLYILERELKINGDLNYDKRVDFKDYAILAGKWASTDCNEINNWCDKGDIDHSGSVDFCDLLIMAEKWLEGNIEPEITWVSINDPGFNGQMSKYETTNAQYCQFLNTAHASGDIIVDGNNVIGANGSNGGEDFAGQVYYNLAGAGSTENGAMNGGAARINYSGGVFSVDPNFEDHPVTYVSWYGATAFCNYYGYRLPTEWEWQAVADYNSSYIYGCGTTINNSIANSLNSTHPYGTTPVGAFGTYGYGMCDMAGNVWEWTTSMYSGSSRVVRGGSWYDIFIYYSTVSFRNEHDPSTLDYLAGFRACR